MKKMVKPEVKAAKDPTSLGNLLLQDGLCTASQLHEALHERARQEDQFLGETMVKMGIITQDILDAYLKRQQVLRSTRSNSRKAMYVASAAAHGTLAFSGRLDALNDLALQVLQKLK